MIYEGATHTADTTKYHLCLCSCHVVLVSILEQTEQVSRFKAGQRNPLCVLLAGGSVWFTVIDSHSCDRCSIHMYSQLSWVVSIMQTATKATGLQLCCLLDPSSLLFVYRVNPLLMGLSVDKRVNEKEQICEALSRGYRRHHSNFFSGHCDTMLVCEMIMIKQKLLEITTTVWEDW